jgi:hypothetical protein
MQTDSYSLADIENFAARFYQGRGLLLTPYAYNTNFAALAQGATASNVINIAANADFIVTGLHHRANTGSAQNISTKTAPFVRVLLTDTGSNEQFTAQAVDLENYSTNGNIVNQLPYPRILSGRSSVTVQATSYAPTAETYNLDIMLEGVLVRAYDLPTAA